MSKVISEILHPSITPAIQTEWALWRLTLLGGSEYIAAALQKYSKAEDDDDYAARLKQTYNPARAKSAIFEVRNAIFQRLADVIRDGGSDSYQNAVAGKDGGVDLKDNSMMTFLGDAVLPDLLGMGAIYVMVDMPHVPVDATLADTNGLRPYVYTYTVEDVLSWVPDFSSDPGMFSSILVRHTREVIDPMYGLPEGMETIFRLMSRVPDGVQVRDFNEDGEEIGGTLLLIDEIPVIKTSVYDSLLKEIAHHQFAMLQMASADVTALVKGNFSLYVEQIDPAYQDDIRGSAHPSSIGNDPGGEPWPEPLDRHTQLVNDGVYSARHRQGVDGRSMIGTGPSQGRGYMKGMNSPAFISPSQDPALASMKKQKELADEIKVLIDLALTGLGASYAAAESKRLDQGGLEAGLSYIGLQLHMLEQSIARVWEKFVDKNQAPAEIKYPKNYNIKSDSQRRDEAKDLQELQGAVPSIQYQKSIAKQVVLTLLGDKVSQDLIQEIVKEIDDAPGLTADPDTIGKDIETGVVSVKTASALRGYGPEEAEAAKKDHADKAARISAAQAAASEASSRGVEDMDTDPKGAAAEKSATQDPTLDPNAVGKKVRGAASK